MEDNKEKETLPIRVLDKYNVLFPGPIGDYKLPFEKEVGLFPSLEDIQDVVVLKKLRPQFKEHWFKVAVSHK